MLLVLLRGNNMQIIQLDDYGLSQDDVIPGVLVQGDIGQVYDNVVFMQFLDSLDEGK